MSTTHPTTIAVIKFNAPTGQYIIPLMAVAIHRAASYAKEDGYEQGTKYWNIEVRFVMKDDFEGIDWLINNSNPGEWMPVATKISSDILVDDDDFWTDSDDFELLQVNVSIGGAS